ncbi:UvsY-like recombination mediator [Serratia phage vB_SmaA_3M]|uniref:Putative DNA repair/recombination protein n=1 Tax=Serratia phage vB_SmaA_3M TaxID=2419930 RepID=A0A3G2YS48_9CAUD|nr:UvsY-like recombination mediator [Serratia phage vB_SmaA_3M]AYP28333.1 putative DNA repair/recombination protein [Serratia phage vB_SmaA_3M]
MTELKEIPYEDLFDGIKTIPLDYIMDAMEKSLDIDPNSRNLDTTSLTTSRLFMEAQRFYIHEVRVLEKVIAKKNKTDLYLRRYYAGELPSQVYQARPLPVKPLKSDIDVWIKADDNYIEMTTLLEEQKRKVKFIESCFDRIKSRGYEIKTAIDWRRYLDGN